MSFASIAKKSQAELKDTLIAELKGIGYKTKTQDGFIYAKGTIPVMLIAHMDTVHKTPPRTICYSSNGEIVMSPDGIGGDDRTGVYMILEIIKNHRCHVLFCEDEECGGIGARMFTLSGIKPKINFMVEIDRRGSNDAVFYDCENPKFTKFVTSFGFEEEFGSFSDISIIAPHLGIAAVNISAGYFNEHTLHEYVDLAAVRNNIERVSNLVSAKSDRFEYMEAVRYSRSYKNGNVTYSSYYNKGSATLDTNYDDYHTLDDKVVTKQLEPLYAPDYVINPEHEMEESNGDFLIDKEGKVYEDNEYIGYAVEADGYRAFREQGKPAVFNADMAFEFEVVSEDYAYLLELNLCHY